MITKSQYYNLLDEIAGKTIAVVYIFENEKAAGFKHYDVWKSNLISCWINAIQELRCIPYILDVRTFIFKITNNTLPHIDFVINMNAGCEDLSTLGLVPSACGFQNLECIPCNTSAIITGEHKRIANMIAQCCDFNVPKVSKTSKSIFRPLNFGSSKGVYLTKDYPDNNTNIEGIFQEFIPGYDVTTPLMYNPLTEEINPLPSIIYYPECNDINWYLSDTVKKTSSGFTREILPNISGKLTDSFINLMQNFDIDTYCRIDSRLYSEKRLSLSEIKRLTFNKENCYFIEMNPMPTIEIGNNFYVSMMSISQDFAFYDTITYYNEKTENHSFHGFILSCAIIKKIISKHKK